MLRIIKWIDIRDKLPLEKYKGEGNISDEFLVTIRPKDLDPNDPPCIHILWFTSCNGYFSHLPGGPSYESEHDHFVTHWAELPESA